MQPREAFLDRCRGSRPSRVRCQQTATSTRTASRSHPDHRTAASRLGARQQLQREVQRPRHRHDDRADLARREAHRVREDLRGAPFRTHVPEGLASPPRWLRCVLVGSSSGACRPADGTSATAKAGCLIVVDSKGHVRETLSGHGINGPWDATASQSGTTADLFITNVLERHQSCCR